MAANGTRRLAITATERALQPHLPPPAALKAQCLSLRKGDTVNLEELATTLSQLGYERVPTIEQEGSWSRRGDIVDVFPVSAELPVRLEFFGEELDKLREFDPASQRSLDPVKVVRLTPTGYGPLIAAALRETMPDGLETLLGAEATDQLLEGGTPEGMRRLMGLAWQQPASLLDYLPASTLIAIDERRHCLAHGQQWFDHAQDHLQELQLPELPGCLHRPPQQALAEAEHHGGGHQQRERSGEHAPGVGAQVAQQDEKRAEVARALCLSHEAAPGGASHRLAVVAEWAPLPPERLAP